jgi:type I restriction enzyme S subunit
MTISLASVALGNVVELIMGQAPPSKDCNFEGKGTPFVKVGEFREIRPEICEWTTNPLRMARRTDVLLCVVGATCGKINLGEDCAIGRSVAAIRPNSEKVDQFYLYYFMMTLVERLRSGSLGAAQTVISKPMVESVQIPLPPLMEQKRIVGILDRAFGAIDTAKANAEKNCENARVLLGSCVRSVLSRRGRGWVERQLGDVCDFKGGSQPPKSQFIHVPRSGYVRFLQIRDFGSDKHVTFIPASQNNRLCDENDILIGRYGASVGKILTGKAGAYNVALIKTLPNLSMLNRDFFAYYLRSAGFQERLMKVAFRSAQNGFSREDIYSFPVSVPPLSEQQAIVERMEPVAAETRQLEAVYQQKLAVLDRLKSSLLHNSFSGTL